MTTWPAARRARRSKRSGSEQIGPIVAVWPWTKSRWCCRRAQPNICRVIDYREAFDRAGVR